MNLNRIVLTCVLLLLAVALALPWWIGRDVEVRYRELVSSTTEAPVPFRLQLETFERGWFNSRARVSVQAATGGAETLLQALGHDGGGLVLTDRIAHGLFPLRGPGPGLGWRPALASVDGRLRAEDEPDAEMLARIAYRIGLDGGLVLAFAAPGSGETGASSSRALAWRDLGINATIPAGSGTAGLDVSADTFEMPQPLGRMVLHELALNLHASLPRAGLPTGSLEMRAEQAVMVGADGANRMGAADNLALSAAFDTGEARARGTVVGRLDRLGSPRETYGPGEFRLTVERLDAESLGRLIDGVARVRARRLDGRAGAVALAGALLAEVPTLLAHGAILELERLELESRDGVLRARGRLGLASTKPVVLNNPYLLQQALTGSFEVLVPPVAARHAALIHLRRNGLLGDHTPDSWLDEQVSRGRLTREGGDYRLAVQLAEGRVTVNGRLWAEMGR